MKDAVKHLTQNDLANRWNKSVHTIERYRSDGTGPVYLKIGGKDVCDWLTLRNSNRKECFYVPMLQSQLLRKPANQD